MLFLNNIVGAIRTTISVKATHLARVLYRKRSVLLQSGGDPEVCLIYSRRCKIVSSRKSIQGMLLEVWGFRVCAELDVGVPPLLRDPIYRCHLCDADICSSVFSPAPDVHQVWYISNQEG